MDSAAQQAAPDHIQAKQYQGHRHQTAEGRLRNTPPQADPQPQADADRDAGPQGPQEALAVEHPGTLEGGDQKPCGFTEV